jgi:hypothetical protein
MDKTTTRHKTQPASQSPIHYDLGRVEQVSRRKRRTLLPITCHNTEHSIIDRHSTKHLDSSYFSNRFVELIEHNREKAKQRLENSRMKYQDFNKTKVKHTLQQLVSNESHQLDEAGSFMLENKVLGQPQADETSRTSQSRTVLFRLLSNMNFSKGNDVGKRHAIKNNCGSFQRQAQFKETRMSSFHRKSSSINGKQELSMTNVSEKNEPKLRLVKYEYSFIKPRASQLSLKSLSSQSKFVNANNEDSLLKNPTNKELTRKSTFHGLTPPPMNRRVSINEVDKDKVKATKAYDRFNKRRSQPSILLSETVDNLDLILIRRPLQNFCDFSYLIEQHSRPPTRAHPMAKINPSSEFESKEIVSSIALAEKGLPIHKADKENILTQQQFSRWTTNSTKLIPRLDRVHSFYSKLRNSKHSKPTANPNNRPTSVFYHEMQESKIQTTTPPSSGWMAMIDKLLAVAKLSDLQDIGYYQGTSGIHRFRGTPESALMEKVRTDIVFSQKYGFMYRPN